MPCGALEKSFLFLIKNTRSSSKRTHYLEIEADFLAFGGKFFLGAFLKKSLSARVDAGKGRPGALFLRGRRRFGVSLYDFGKFWMMDFVKGFARSVYYGF